MTVHVNFLPSNQTSQSFPVKYKKKIKMSVPIAIRTLTLSARQIKTDTCANSVDPDEMVTSLLS